LQEPLTICGGEEIRGKIACKRNEKNPRDLDIEIQVDFDGKCMAGHNAVQQYRLR
jgi:hypothetical protein